MSNENPLVSVIMPTYNRQALLSRAISSIVEQSYDNIEIVVVNDAGEEPSMVIDFYTKMLQDYSKSIKYLSNEKNVGLAATRNVGLKNCAGDYICLLDDDDIYLKYAIEFRMSMIQKLNAEIVYTRSLLDIWRKVEGDDTKYTSAGKRLYWDSPFNRDLILVQNISPCCNPLFSRKSWQDSDYYMFDETLNTGEDYDFWIALSRKNRFEELKLIDTECSQREDNTQMTGSRNFWESYPIIYRKWRHTADDLQAVTERQNAMLTKMEYPTF